MHPLLPTGGPRDCILQEVAATLRSASGDITNIETVLAASSVCADDIADEFGSETGLVMALTDAAVLTTLEALDDCTTEAGFRNSLLAFGNRVTDRDSGAQLKHLYRIALSDAVGDADIGRTFYRHGPGLVRDELSRFFSSARASGIGLSGDSHRLASHLMSLLRASWDFSGTASGDDRC